MRSRISAGGRTFAVVAVVGAFLLGGATYGAVQIAGASGSSVTYFACLSSGTLTKVGTKAPKCTIRGSTEISWNSIGPKGATGATGPQGPVAPCTGIPHVGIDLSGCDLEGKFWRRRGCWR